MSKFEPKRGYKYHTVSKKDKWKLYIEGMEIFELTENTGAGLNELTKYANALVQYCQDVRRRPMTQVTSKHYLFNSTGEK